MLFATVKLAQNCVKMPWINLKTPSVLANQRNMPKMYRHPKNQHHYKFLFFARFSVSAHHSLDIRRKCKVWRLLELSRKPLIFRVSLNSQKAGKYKHQSQDLSASVQALKEERTEAPMRKNTHLMKALCSRKT